jgi:putative ABC transport system permease protein
MLRNYLITALRNFTRHKLYGVINLLGLTVGLLCAIFIALFVRDQLSYDSWIPDTQNLYRAEATGHNPGQPPLHFAFVSFPVTKAMQEQIPEVKSQARLTPENMTVGVGPRQFSESVNVVDPNFFTVIELPLIQGERANLFRQPDSVVLSQSAAKKYFGAADPMGKTLTVSGMPWNGNSLIRHDLTVTGVMKDIPHNSQLSGDVFFPNTSKADLMPQTEKTAWMDVNNLGYVRLAPGAQPGQVATKLRAMLDRSFDPAILLHVKERGSQALEITLTPFRDAHLSTDRYGGMTPAGSWATVYGFAVIGALILLVACFNFTNLATARAMLRAREISLRKVMGAGRHQLIAQFLSESVATALVALVIALAMAEVLLPLFDRFLGAPIVLDYASDWVLILALVGVAILAGLISGFYPALVLSNFRPAFVLRTNRSGNSGSGLFRTALVVLQFAVSIGLGIAALVVFEQVSYARNIDLGFVRDNIVIVDAGNLSAQSRTAFVRALRADPAIQDASLSDATPFGEGLKNNVFVHRQGQASNDSFRSISIGPGFLRLYDIGLAAGRALSESHGPDLFADDGHPHNVLINQAAARRLGFSPGEALGQRFMLAPDNDEVTVVGVTHDFKIEGSKTPPAATIYRFVPSQSHFVSVKLRGGLITKGVSEIDRTWRDFAPTLAVQRHFLDQDFDRQFQADAKEDSIFGLFVGIAIFIAAMGLFGLAAFVIAGRTREIGIRKVFGARTVDIVLLLLWQFSLPVLIANLIAWPVAYYYLRGWLEGYAYRISLNPLYFVSTGLAALLIAWATILLHAGRAARANPIHALRYE